MRVPAQRAETRQRAAHLGFAELPFDVFEFMDLGVSKVGNLTEHQQFVTAESAGGFNIKLNGLVPLEGNIVVRSVKDRKPDADQGDESAFVSDDGVVA